MSRIRTINTWTVCLVMAVALLFVSFGGVIDHAAGGERLPTAGTKIQMAKIVSPLTGKTYEYPVSWTHAEKMKAITDPEMRRVTNTSWELISPRIRLTYDKGNGEVRAVGGQNKPGKGTGEGK